MKLITKKMPVDFNLFLFGDTHEGTRLFFDGAFDTFIDTLCSPYDGLSASRNFCVHHGDAIEAVTVDDKRFDPGTVVDPRGTPFDQAKSQIKRLWPIKDKLLCLLMGNHELALRKFGNLSKVMADELGVPYGTYAAKITYVDHKGELIFKHYLTHGRKSITSTADDPKRRKTNMELILKRQLKFKAGDALLMSKGHTHKLLVCEPNSELYLTDDGGKLHQNYTHSRRNAGYIHPDHRWYVNTGSFYLGSLIDEVGYAEAFEYDPLETGYAVCLVRDRIIVDVKRCVVAG